RNKIQIPFAAEGKETVAGFFAPGSHRIVGIEDCLIHPREMVELALFVRDRLKEWRLPAYSEARLSGWLRHLVVRQEMHGGKMLATFVTTKDFFPRRSEWMALIREKFPQVSGVCQNINEERTNV